MDDIQNCHGKAVGRWTGCDWPTRFGPCELNLQGLTAAQAQLLAQATGGAESTAWREAAHWLARVERAAREAETEAWAALGCVEHRDLEQALFHARRACLLEEPYHADCVWRPLHDAIEAAWKREVQTAQ